MRAFKHADRFLLGTSLPLPPIVDGEELYDQKVAAAERQREEIRVARETREKESAPPSAEQSQKVSELLQNWRTRNGGDADDKSGDADNKILDSYV